ncbi:Ppx/GppA phosphatase family protein [Actinophytocola oryzae]|uniref:Exopolyphosphatase/guanosine-5'-triphosphate, 3'-diphosphate pyrophosphatase n=1 Tax=Actinophytocola oryzae TaxID=502181 RepID=A0A4V3FSM5_9PSEU|nr:exopolyphosphatase [Actinophytocola oryzae]TDV48031.1 exopolyphosphatase/guanosine-5'-triphosphate,3'-diphosphate pyrophosphatase [Actinophytocola oryzae]
MATKSTPRDKESARVAVLDVGCFSAHLLVVDHTPDRQVVSHKVRLRLDQAIDADGRITRRGIEHIVDAVQTTEQRLHGLGAGRFLPFATSSVRDATNADTVVETVAERTGVTLRFLTGKQEARLAYQAARHWHGPADALTVLDVGGGTVEIAYGATRRPAFTCSLPLGARTLTMAGLTDTTDLDDTRTMLRGEIRDAIPPELRGALAEAPATGCSKVFESLAKLAGTNHLRADDIAAWIPLLARLSPRHRARLPGISSHRARQVFAGAVVAEALMTATGHASIDICPWSTREGVLLGLLELN